MLENDTITPAGCQKVTYHLLIDMKVYFTRNNRLVLDRYKDLDTIGSTYASIVSRDSVIIAFTYASINVLYMCVTDIRNTYIQAPLSKKD